MNEQQAFNFIAFHRQPDFGLIRMCLHVKNEEIVVNWVSVNVVPERLLQILVK
jgi:hypothetical protein